MYIHALVIISVISLFSFGGNISNFIVKKRSVISKLLYMLSFLSFFLLLSDVTIQKTGEISIWLLWFLLWLPILSKVGNLVIPRKLMLFRQEIGILMGVMAFIHSAQYFLEPYAYMFWEIGFWIEGGYLSYLAWGMLALIIAIILSVTSNNRSRKFFGGKGWKRIHRATYILIILSLLHVAIYKMFGGDIFGELFETFIPFFIYFVGKLLEWNNVKLRENFIIL